MGQRLSSSSAFPTIPSAHSTQTHWWPHGTSAATASATSQTLQNLGTGDPCNNGDPCNPADPEEVSLILLVGLDSPLLPVSWPPLGY